MLRTLIVAVVGALPSLGLILWIESGARRLAGGSLARWRRLLIPMPIILALAGFGVPALALMVSHLFGGSARHVSFLYWSIVTFPYLALLAVGLLPFFLADSLRKRLRLLPVVWGGHIIWMVFPYLPWVMMSFGD